MLTREQLSELWHGNDLISLGAAADALRKKLHPNSIVSYTLTAEEGLIEHTFRSTETVAQRLDILDQLRNGQNESGEILVFRPLVDETATGMEYMKTIALSRLYFDNVPHIQGACQRFGMKIAQLSLRFGADDLGLPDAAANEEELRRLIRDAGFVPKRRDALFRSYSVA